jgi:hypothetical protein
MGVTYLGPPWLSGSYRARFGPYFTMLNDGDYNYQSFNYINWDWSNSSEPYYRDSWKSWAAGLGIGPAPTLISYIASSYCA